MSDELRNAGDRVAQIFECEVCGEEYEVESDYEIEKITVDCRNCVAISSWAFPKKEATA